MPSASSKTEIKASPEAQDSFKQMQLLIDKKGRNLEKRKGKLDTYKEKLTKGETLDPEQKEAAKRYDGVVANIELVREFQKQIVTLNQEAERSQKKREKRERMERQTAEVKRVEEILRFQLLMEALGSDDVRADLMAGKNGAPTVTKQQLDQVDEFYPLMNPTSLTEPALLTTAAEHTVALLEGREKGCGIEGVTYHDLKIVMDTMVNSGYFDKEREETGEEEDESVEQVAVGGVEPGQEADEQEAEEFVPEDEEPIDDGCERVESLVFVNEQVKSGAGEPKQFISSTPSESSASASATSLTPNPTYDSNPFYPAPVPPTQQTLAASQPVLNAPDLPASSQSSFDFLQESTIEVEAPHMDPAVVAAKPMNTASAEPSIPPPYNTTTPRQPLQSKPPHVPAPTSMTGSGNQSMEFVARPPTGGSQVPAAAYLPAEAAGAPYAVPSHVQPPPPAIPMPRQMSQQEVDDKKFTMNPNAAMFYSTYSGAASSQLPGSEHMVSNSASEESIGYPGEFAQDFGGTFTVHRGGNGIPSRGSNNPRGGPNPRSRGGSGAVTNGYQRGGGGGGGGRGGGPVPAGQPPYNTSRPNQRPGNNGRGGGGGGGALPPRGPRSDYDVMGDTGYNGADGTKRPVAGAAGGGSRGGGGAAARGNARTGPARGGGGGYNR